jgi:hypothetical protein
MAAECPSPRFRQGQPGTLACLHGRLPNCDLTGLFQSGDNDDIVLFEDDNAIWKLEEPWVDFSVEPWFDETVEVCDR